MERGVATNNFGEINIYLNINPQYKGYLKRCNIDNIYNVIGFPNRINIKKSKHDHIES